MKKIIMGMAAVAMAASMFAVDFSAAAKFNGSLFNMAFTDGAKASALQLDPVKAQKGHGQTGIDLNVYADKAGASIALGNGYDGSTNVSYQAVKIWVNPTDNIKINLGELDYCINKESIDWAGCINGAGLQGFGIDFAIVDGLSASLVLNPGYSTPWLKDGVIGNTAAYVKYNGGDAGNFGVAWIGTPDGDKAFANNTVSVGYGNTFDAVSMFADVAFDLTKDGLKYIKADAFVKASADAFGVAAYFDLKQDMKADKDATAVGAKAKFTYALDNCTPYLYVKAANVLASPFAIEVKPGVNFNIGAAGVEIAADINVEGSKATLNVPFGVSIGF